MCSKEKELYNQFQCLQKDGHRTKEIARNLGLPLIQLCQMMTRWNVRPDKTKATIALNERYLAYLALKEKNLAYTLTECARKLDVRVDTLAYTIKKGKLLYGTQES